MLSKAVVATVALSALGLAAPAKAGTTCVGTGPTICLGLQEAGVNSGNITTEAVGPADVGVNISSLIYGTFTVTNAGGVDAGSGSGRIDFGSDTLDVSATDSKTLNVFVTEFNISNPTGHVTYDSTLTENNLPAGWTVAETTWFDSANAPYGMADSLQTHTFLSDSTSDKIGSYLASGPYSLTEEYVITLGSEATRGLDISTIHVGAAPESSTWAMMLIGFVGLGSTAVRRGRKDRLAPAIG
jgi:hypothetical protein